MSVEKRDLCLSYINHFSKKVAGLISDAEIKKFVTATLGGKKLSDASDEDVFSVALRMYLIYLVHLTPPTLSNIMHLTVENAKAYLKDLRALDKSYGVERSDFKTIIKDANEKGAIDHMKGVYTGGYSNSLNKIFDSPVAKVKKAVKKATKSTASPKKPAVKKPAKKASPAASPKKVVKKKISISGKAASPVKKSSPSGTKKPVKSSLKTSGKTKQCAEYLKSELLKLAKEKGLKNYSALNKEQLCQALKIR